VATRLAILTFLLVLLAAACDDDAEDGGSDVTGAWVLVSGARDGVELPLVDGYRITLTIEDGSLGGTAACNLYGGDAEIKDALLRIGELSVTARGCEPAVMVSEQAYLAALASADAIGREGAELVLTGPRTELRFEALPPVPTAELIGTVWVLETLIEGDTATSVAGEQATLELRVDGSLRGSTGCRPLSGRYVVGGDEVVATSLAAEGECPAELAAQDSHVVTVLGDGFTVAIDGDRLTLQSQGLLGAIYRAR
jgi:heat shock protein HslJ